jgi:hypothetical protein
MLGMWYIAIFVIAALLLFGIAYTLNSLGSDDNDDWPGMSNEL